MEGNKTNIHEAHEDHQKKAAENLLQKTLEDLVKVLSSKKDNDKTNACIEVQQNALEDLVNVNSLFAIAVFVGMAFANLNQRSLENRPECDPDPGLEKMLIIYEVNSFACFLLSSLVAKSTKILLNIHKKEQTRNHRLVPDRLCKKVLLSEPWKRFSLGVTVLASFAGIVLMTLSMVNVIQIRVGKLFCGSNYAIKAVAPLYAIVFIALLFYVPSMAYAVIVTASACQNCEDMKMASIDSGTPKAPADV